MCSIFNWSAEIWTAIGTVLLFLVTVGLLIVAKRGFDSVLNQEASKEQLREVGRLIDDIVNTRIQFSRFNIPDFSILEGTYTIFEFARVEMQINSSNYFLMSPPNAANGIFLPVWRHIQSPLLPQEIANALGELGEMGIETRLGPENNTQRYFVLGAVSLENDTRFLHDPLGVNHFISVCINIRESILKYYKRKNIKDINYYALILPNPH